MELSARILSDVIIHNKYAKFLEKETRRETWEEIVSRNKGMHLKKFSKNEEIKALIEEAYPYVYNRKVLPSMRALENSTPILTKSGWKTAENVVEGDILFDSFGNETKVLGTTGFSNKDLYQIIFSDGSTLTACDDHLWIIKTLDDLKRKQNTRVVTTSFLREHLKQGDRNNLHVPLTEPLHRASIKLDLDPYILGIWLGDGYSSGYQYSTSEQDSDFFKLEYEKQGFTVKHSVSSNIWTWTVRGLADKLRQLNLLNNKHIPNKYLQASKEQRLALVQGLMDTDGCITSKGRCLFYNTNKKIIKGFKELLSGLGIKYTVLIQKQLKSHHQQGYTISFFTTLSVSRLPRKKQNIRIDLTNQRTRYRTIKEIKWVGKGDATCFHVDSPDRSFLAGKQMIITHNSMQFAGKSIELNPARGYNCSFMPMTTIEAFSELMFLLLCGCGVGYSVQKHHVSKLPPILRPRKEKRVLVADSIEGWADAVKALMEAYFLGRGRPKFDFSDIRPKGTQIKTSGGKAPGPEPLKDCLHNIQKILDRKNYGDQLTPLEVHDINCYIADAVLAGGIRRSAMIALFSFDDDEMLTCKFGKWYETNSQRGRANNSVVILRHKVSEEDFQALWKKIKASGTGEPGFFMSNDKEWGLNPSLRAGTRVLTGDGVYRIEDLQDKEFTVKNLYGQDSQARCWLSSPSARLVKITLQGGKEIFASEKHQWPVFEKDGDVPIKYTSENLRPGMLLPIPKNDTLTQGTLGSYNDGFVLGWLYGDGWIINRQNFPELGFILNKEDFENGIGDKIVTHLKYLQPKFFGVFHKDVETNTYVMHVNNRFIGQYFQSLGVSCKEDGIPNGLWTGSEDIRKGFVDGLFSSDGSIDVDNNRTNPVRRIQLTSSRKKIIEDLRDLLGFYGIQTSVRHVTIKEAKFPNKKNYDKTYHAFILKTNKIWDLIRFRDLFTLSHARKQTLLLGVDYKNRTNKQNNIRIDSVEAVEIYEPVWDISVQDETHCFQLSNCITGNCGEISLRPYQFCNLVTLDISDINTQEELNARVRAATIIATLQASYTEFHYLNEEWQATTEKEALIGVSMTGIASNKNLKLDFKEASSVVKQINAKVSKLLNINQASRTTCVKPEGTSSLVLGTSSGIHPWHSEYYIRRVTVLKNEPLYFYLRQHIPDLLEDNVLKPNAEAFITIPVKAPNGAITRSESALDLLKRVTNIYDNWIVGGHRKGNNTNNVSTTITIKPDEWDQVGKWMWDNRTKYTALSVLPHDDHTYSQTPFEDINEEKYKELIKKVHEIDLSKVLEYEDVTELQAEIACGGGACEIK